MLITKDNEISNHSLSSQFRLHGTIRLVYLLVFFQVKASKDSKNLHSLGEASKGVSEAVGSVMASARSAAQLIEDMGQ